MIARLTGFEGPPESHLEGVRAYEDNALDWMREATGFRGMLILADEESGRSVTVTFWEDAASETANEQASKLFRDLAAAAGARTERFGPELYEVVLTEGIRFDPISLGPPR